MVRVRLGRYAINLQAHSENLERLLIECLGDAIDNDLTTELTQPNIHVIFRAASPELTDHDFDFSSNASQTLKKLSITRHHFMIREGNILRCLIWSETDITPTGFFYRHVDPAIKAAAWSLGYIALHACAVVDAKIGPILLLGDRGTGKSTGCVALSMAGCEVITDDLVFVDFTNPTDPMLIGFLRELHLVRDLCVSSNIIPDAAARPDYYPQTGRIAVKPSEMPNLRFIHQTSLGQPLFLFLSPTRFDDFRVTPISDPAELLSLVVAHWERIPDLCTRHENITAVRRLNEVIHRGTAWKVLGWPTLIEIPAYGKNLLKHLRTLVDVEV